MRTFFKVALVTGFISASLGSWALAQAPTPTVEELKKKYVPQALPEESYRLELDLISQGDRKSTRLNSSH